jgi:surface antigen
MKQTFKLGSFIAVAIILSAATIPVHAQSIQNTSNDSPYINDENCSISNSGSSSSDTTNTNESTIPTVGNISYQGGSISPISTDTSIYPTISYTPRITTSDATFSIQDTTDTTIIRDTLAYPTKIYTSSTTTSDDTINYLDGGSITLSTNTTQYPSLSVKTSTYSSYPSISYQVNELSTNETISVESTNTCTVPIESENTTVNEPITVNLPSINANLSVNDEYILYVNYEDSATVKWESTGTSSCSLDPIGQSGTEGQYVLQDVTSNMIITIDCEAGPGYAKYQTSPSWLGRVEVKVLPPTFDYLKSYLSQIQPSSNKKLNLNSASNFIDQAQKAKKTDLAKAFLQKSVDNLKQQGAKGVIPAVQITKYEEAANYLSKTLTVKVVIAADGCSVTATGPSGLILQYGANENMRRGYGDEATFPASGTITATIYAPNGWQSTAEVIDSTGLIYARDTKDVTTDNCPIPPVVYDPSVYNGYPEKWAVPEVGTVIDDWGYFNKTAESYVAFRVTDSSRTFPTGYGNASEWLDAATADGYVVEIPQAGDIAINTLDASFGGPIAWYVDSVDGLGNYQTSAIRSDGNMNWSNGTVSDSTYLKYIRIP